MTEEEAIAIIDANDDTFPHGQHWQTGDRCECDDCTEFNIARRVLAQAEHEHHQNESK